MVEIGSRQILHHHATAHPTAEWTLPQFREALPPASSSMIGTASSRRRWTKALPIWGYGFCQRRCEPQRRTPYANDWAAAFVGNVLDVLIPFHQRHLPMTIRDWAIHYHRGRPHSALGPGLPEPMSDQVPSHEHRHSLPIGYQVVKRSVSAAHIMNMGSRRRLLSDGPFFAGIPNQPANCSVFCARPSFWTIRAHGSDIEALPKETGSNKPGRAYGAMAPVLDPTRTPTPPFGPRCGR